MRAIAILRISSTILGSAAVSVVATSVTWKKRFFVTGALLAAVVARMNHDRQTQAVRFRKHGADARGMIGIGEIYCGFFQVHLHTRKPSGASTTPQLVECVAVLRVKATKRDQAVRIPLCLGRGPVIFRAAQSSPSIRR
jgi:hypothetical protein